MLSHREVIRLWGAGICKRNRTVIAKSDAIYSYGSHFPLVVRNTHGTLIFNNSKYSVSTSKHQKICSEEIEYDLAVPFPALIQLGIDPFVSKFTIREMTKTPSEALFEASISDTEAKLVLYGLDTESSYRNTPIRFICVLRKSNKVRTICDAKEALKPDEVKEYENKTGQPAKRQGEWFFIPAEISNDTYCVIEQAPFPGSHRHVAAQATTIDDKFLVRGRIKHLSGHHKSVYLTDWHLAVKNTSLESVSPYGSVD